MGSWTHGGLEGVTGPKERNTPPDHKEIEVTLLGPGYGESIVLHIGGGAWVIVDSCIDDEGIPRSLRYLATIGVDPSEAVVLVVATHWHDDHIRGLAMIVKACTKASFCCAAALRSQEFLTVIGAWGQRPLAKAGSGVRELYRVFSHLHAKGTKPIFALANRRLYDGKECQIWSLSPSDEFFGRFLTSIARLSSAQGRTNTRVPDPKSNDVAVALWIRVGDAIMLLGSDLEKRGWTEVLHSSARPAAKASLFKIPHHGSRSADHPEVWERMLIPYPIATLTPWCLGGRALPNEDDAKRILKHTPHAYITATSHSTRQSKRRVRAVSKMVGESNIKLRRHSVFSGAVQLRRAIDSEESWKVTMFGPVCHLKDFAA